MRIEDFRRRSAADDESAAIKQGSAVGKSAASFVQISSDREGLRGWIVQFRGSECWRCFRFQARSTYDQDFSAGEQNRGVLESGLMHFTGASELLYLRIVDLGRGKNSMLYTDSAHNQNAAIRQQSRGMSSARRGHFPHKRPLARQHRISFGRVKRLHAVGAACDEWAAIAQHGDAGAHPRDVHASAWRELVCVIFVVFGAGKRSAAIGATSD